MITCPYCKSQIDDDSYYCDQCGAELYYCMKCSRHAHGRRCPVCGSVTVRVSDRASMIAMRPSKRFNVSQPEPAPKRAEKPAEPYAPAHPTRLVRMDREDVILPIKDGALIGRVHGEYTDILGTLGYISGDHAQLDYDSETQTWTITDLKSTNGTKVNGSRLAPGVPAPFHLGDKITIAFTDFVVR